MLLETCWMWSTHAIYDNRLPIQLLLSSELGPFEDKQPKFSQNSWFSKLPDGGISHLISLVKMRNRSVFIRYLGAREELEGHMVIRLSYIACILHVQHISRHLEALETWFLVLVSFFLYFLPLRELTYWNPLTSTQFILKLSDKEPDWCVPFRV